jgi:DNA-binding NarL/FixJ family response regulator
VSPRAKAGDEPITLVICDDHHLLTDTFAMVLPRFGRVRLNREPLDHADDAVAACADERPDVVLMDIYLRSSPDGIEATRRIKDVSPSTKVIVMTGELSDRRLMEALEAGADGFVNKAESMQHVLELVEAAGRGQALIETGHLLRAIRGMAADRAGRRDLERRFERLTDRESEVLDLLVQGLRNEAIATRLVISRRTVETHVQNILRKLQVHSKLEAVALMLRRNESLPA